MKKQDFSKIRVFGDALFKRDATLRFEKGSNDIGSLSVDDLENIEAMVALSTGNVYYVHNSDGDDGLPGTKDKPKATWDAAVNLCSAYDTIILLPGHDETITAASAVDLDVASVSTYGIGNGSVQPIIRFNNAAATVKFDAANIVVEGVHFIADVTAVAKGIDIADGADDYRIANCRFSANTLGTDEFEDAIFVTTSDRGTIVDNYIDMDEAGAASGIHIVGACLGADIRGNTILGDYSVGCIEGVTAAAEQLLIQHNTLVNGVHSGLNTVACISLFTGTTGFIQDNRLYTNVTDAVTAAISADGCFLANNTVSTTAETPPVEGEALARGRLEVTSIANVELNDEGEATVTFACDGPVDIYGILGVVTTAADETEELSLTTESGTTLMALGEVHTATAAGDFFFAAEPGDTPTVDEIGTAESFVWDNPVRITGSEDLIDMLAEGDIDGGGAATLYVIWSPVVSGAEVATS